VLNPECGVEYSV